MLKLICATRCSNIYMHPQIHSQDRLYFTLTLAVLRSVALPHLKRGTATLKPRHCRDLSDRWGWGVFIPILFLPNGSLLPLLILARPKEKMSSLSPSISDLEPSSKSIDFSINPWEKRIQNSIREQLHWFSISKEHLVHVLAGGCVCYSWSWASSWLERRPMSLSGLWQPWEVCNHLLQRVKSPLISRVHSLDLRMR